MKTQNFINKALKVHGIKYDYSKVLYEKSSIKVCIICSEHGEFWQTPNKHLSGLGCPICGKLKQAKSHNELAKEKFISKCREVHGDKYDYSKTIYTTSREKVIITCPIHGDFELKANSHLLGQGCPKCGIESSHMSLRKTTEEFILEAKQIHGNKYDYSKVTYINSKTPVTIICSIHGEFKQLPLKHLYALHGCPYCGGSIISNTLKFIEKASIVHNNKYNYDKVNYVNANTKVIITCPLHGDFEQTPHSHLRRSGCPKCNQSKGEQFIKLYLINKNISFIELYLVSVPKDIRERKYCEIDFYLPDYNTFVEYNGMLHYVPIEYFGGLVKFEKLQNRDKFIRNYCKENNINLLEIKYDIPFSRVEKILNNELRRH